MGLSSRSPALQMIEHAPGLIDDLPILLANLEAKIDILKPVSVPFIESAYFLEDLSTHEHAGRGHTIQFPPTGHAGGMGIETAVDVIGQKPLTREGDSRMLNRTVLVQQFTSDDRD